MVGDSINLVAILTFHRSLSDAMSCGSFAKSLVALRISESAMLEFVHGRLVVGHGLRDRAPLLFWL